MSALQPAKDGGVDNRAEALQQRVIPLARHRRRWRVRLHWGIVFAVVASLVLWFAIKTVIGFAF